MRTLSALFGTFLALTAAFSLTAPTFAGELDNEGSVTNVDQRALAAKLPATVVVRVAQDTQAVSILTSNDALSATPAAIQALNAASFKSVQASDQVSAKALELDQDSSTDSWYFHFNNYNYGRPCFNYGGYAFNYSNYYYYPYAGYNYYFYNYNYNYNYGVNYGYPYYGW